VNNILEDRAAIAERDLYLKNTTYLTKIKSPELRKILTKWYNSRELRDKVMATVINAILTDCKPIFSVSVRTLEALVSQDKKNLQHRGRKGIKDGELKQAYVIMKQFFIGGNSFRMLSEADKMRKKAMVVEFCDETTLGMMGVEMQLKLASTHHKIYPRIVGVDIGMKWLMNGSVVAMNGSVVAIVDADSTLILPHVQENIGVSGNVSYVPSYINDNLNDKDNSNHNVTGSQKEFVSFDEDEEVGGAGAGGDVANQYCPISGVPIAEMLKYGIKLYDKPPITRAPPVLQIVSKPRCVVESIYDTGFDDDEFPDSECMPLSESEGLIFNPDGTRRVKV